MTEDFINIDEFLPLGEEEKKESKPNMFSKDETVFTEDILTEEKEEDDKKEEVKEVKTSDVLDNIDNPGEEEDKPLAVNNSFSKLIEKGVLIPFDDEKPIEKYTTKDWEELIEANFEEKTKAIKESTEKTFYDSLPEELQYAAKYVQDGGRDLKSLFKVLSQKEEISELSTDDPDHQEIILRQFLSATNFGSTEEINEQIDNWKESNQLEKWAKKHKPKLDTMYQRIVDKELQEQEEIKKEQLKRKDVYLDNVYKTIKKGELNGIKLDSKKQKFLWEELTQTKYESMSGRPTNLLGHLLEKYQFSEEPRYDLIAEALWLLQDPESYKEEISKNKTTELKEKTIRTLKTEQERKTSNNMFEEKDDPIRKIKREPKNIFARN